MNFSPFGGHFPASIPTIHQFAAKFSHDGAGNAVCPTPQDSNNSRYTANGVPSFTQHHPPQQHMLTSSKYQAATYMSPALYSQQNSVRQDKRQLYDHQELTPELCAVMLQQSHGQQHQQQQMQQNEKRQSSEKVLPHGINLACVALFIIIFY